MDTQELRQEIRQARLDAGLLEDDMANRYDLTMELYRAFEQGRAELPEKTVTLMARDLGAKSRGAIPRSR